MKIRRAELQDLDLIENLWRELMEFHAAIDDYYTVNQDAEDKYRV